MTDSRLGDLDLHLLGEGRHHRLYELDYELGNRPDWVHLPLAGLRRIVDHSTARSSA